MLEQLVRPFQRPDALATKRLVATNKKVEVPEAVLSWGTAGTIAGAEAVEEVGGSFTVITCDDEYDEVKREETEDRITQKLADGTEVPENFVDVKRPTKLTFNKVSEFKPLGYEKTTTGWSTFLISSPIYSPFDDDSKKCKSKFNLKPPA